jgi:DNA polymerase-1
VIPISHDAVKLVHEGMLTLCQMEKVGVNIDVPYLERAIKKTQRKINIDVPYLERAIKKTQRKIRHLEQELKDDDIYQKVWKKRFGVKTKLSSHDQLEKIIFEEMDYKRTGKLTDTGKHKADKAAFELVRLENKYVKKWFYTEELKKAVGTYLKGILRETIDGKMYPIGNLHTAITYRSSYDRINLQNLPIRVQEIAKIIRRCIVAPKGYRILEIDYGGIEVCGGACYHKDPKMIEYIENTKTDMHRDMAKQCYMLKGNKEYWASKDPGMGKMVRYCAKNRFVFPEFYGSYYVQCAETLWEAIELFDLKNEDGVSLRKHLKQKGIKSRGACNPKERPQRGTLEAHIKEVEHDFWNNRFKVYDGWKEDWWQLYLKRGWFKFLTGFVSQGLYNWKQVCNSPIQGDAFHMLLWCMIELQKWMNEEKLKSKIVFEIHDSMVFYAYESEIDLIVEKAEEIMTKKIREHWKWIIVPLTIECELAPKGGNWYEKEKVAA